MRRVWLAGISAVCAFSVSAAVPVRAAEVTRVVVPPVVSLVGIDATVAPPDVLVRAGEMLEAALARAPFEVRRWRLEAGVPGPKPVPPEISAQLQKARTASRELDYTKAVQLYNAVIDALDRRLEELGDAQGLSDVQVALAGVYLAMEEPALAAAALDKAVSLRPGTGLDPRRYPPALVAAFGDARTRAFAEPGAKVAVEVRPAGAAVYVDGLMVGETPTTLELRKGPHLVQIMAEGHGAWSARVEAVAGGKIKLAETLVRARAYELVDDLKLEAQGRARRTEALAVARRLANEVGADAALVVGLAPIKGGYGLFAILASEPPQAIVGVSAAGLDRAGVVFATMLNRLAALNRQPATAPVEVVSLGESGVTLQGLSVAFDQQLLGIAAPPPSTLTAASEPAPGVTGLTAGAPGQQSVVRSPWLWTGVAVAALSGVVVAYVLLRDRGVGVIQDPSQLRVTAELLP